MIGCYTILLILILILFYIYIYIYTGIVAKVTKNIYLRE